MRNAIVSVCCVVACASLGAEAQPFANAQRSQAQYPGGEIRPAGPCEQLHTTGIADVVVHLEPVGAHTGPPPA